MILVGEFGLGDGYGIGSDEEYTIDDLARLFGKKIEYLPEQLANRETATLVTTKTRNLGWYPNYSLRKYIEDWKKNVEII